ncbi:hypothetical protein AMST5_00212 [freshwater sediment metagenome]|uniref:Uncharacterized protein n=1 Tax=freshwater sediment metagenome TaxID=556182 RepID=A0AA48LWY4_9ZZZZ
MYINCGKLDRMLNGALNSRSCDPQDTFYFAFYTGQKRYGNRSIDGADQ